MSQDNKKNKRVNQPKVFAYILCIIILLFILPACSDNIVELNTQSTQENPHNRTVSLQALIDYFPTNDFEVEDIVSLYGQPLAVDYLPYPNHHIAGQIDGISTFYYEGFEFSVYQVVKSDKAILMDIVHTSANYEPPLEINIGSSYDDVLATMGIPYDRHKNIDIYLLSEAGETLLLTIEENIVTEIMWLFYWD